MRRPVIGGDYGRHQARGRKPDDPFRWFDSSPEVSRLVVMMYVATSSLVCQNSGGADT